MKLKQTFDGKWLQEPFSGCWLWERATVNPGGYGTLWHNGKHMLAHRASWRIHHGDIPNGMMVLHKCDTPACVNPDHLYVGTAAQNILDSIQRGRYNRPNGTKHHAAKLTDSQVREIRSLKDHPADIAKRFGVSRSHVISIQKFKKWKTTERKQDVLSKTEA